MAKKNLVSHIHDLDIHTEVLCAARRTATQFSLPASRGDDFMHALETWTLESMRTVRRLGDCHYFKRRIRISESNVDPRERDNTLRHELAHALKNFLALSGTAHGKEWKACARALGADPRASSVRPAFHEQVQRDPRMRVVARCLSCDYEVIQTRASRRNWSSYSCARKVGGRKCGGRFTKVD